MRQRTRPWIRLSAVLCALAVALLMAAPAAATDPPPINRTYLLLVFGQVDVESPQLQLGADCFTVTETEMCASLLDICGTWSFTDVDGKESGIAFEFDAEIDGVQTQFDGQMRVEDRGRKNSMGGAARLRIPGRTTNFALAGRPMSPARCAEALEELMVLFGG